MLKVRTRFAPSPTGMIHLGNARAALWNALFAKKNEGAFILRIEDTDLARSSAQYVESLKQDLNWLGIAWQEGPDAGGHFGPYYQSQRQDIYNNFYRKLEEKKLIYPCFCTDQELALARKLQLSKGIAPRYSGICRRLSAEAIQEKLATTKPAWRFVVPTDQTISFDDLVKGPQHFESADIGDFIVRRADGTPPFLFCNAIDDAMMQVSYVLRGEDHVANTPRQIMLLNAMELPIAQYGHLPLIMGDDGTPLAKRHGSFSVSLIHDDGYLAIAVINYLARLGHTCDTQELLEFDDLAEHFHIDRLSRSPARFDIAQLNYWQKTAVHQLKVDEVWQWLGDAVKQCVPADKQTLFAEMIKANVIFPKEAKQWIDVFFNEDFNLHYEDENYFKEAGDSYFLIAKIAIAQHGIDLVSVCNELKSQLNINGKKLFMPLRLALTGKTHGPELAVIGELLGKEKMLQRVDAIFAMIA